MTRSATGIAFEHPEALRERIEASADRVRWVDVPGCRQFAVDGTGAAGGPEFKDAFGALYPVAYTLHFLLKRRGVEAPIGALEGLFSVADGAPITPSLFALEGQERQWRWSLRLPVPASASEEDIRAAVADVRQKKQPAALARIQVLTWTEGPSVQILHVGPYSAEQATIAHLHETIAAAGPQPRGRHHEIYISDPNRTAPERLKTVIRQPVEAMS